MRGSWLLPPLTLIPVLRGRNITCTSNINMLSCANIDNNISILSYSGKFVGSESMPLTSYTHITSEGRRSNWVLRKHRFCEWNVVNGFMSSSCFWTRRKLNRKTEKSTPLCKLAGHIRSMGQVGYGWKCFQSKRYSRMKALPGEPGGICKR